MVFATGYRPHLDCLSLLGAPDRDGMPLHSAGISVTRPGLIYAGLEFQRSFSSNALRGVHRDAERLIARWPLTCATPLPPSACRYTGPSRARSPRRPVRNRWGRNETCEYAPAVQPDQSQGAATC